MNFNFFIEKLATLNVVNESYLKEYVIFCLNANVEKETFKTQNHHILPRAVFPEYDDLSVYFWNKVCLTNDNHYIAHALLHLAVNNISFASAWYAMNNKNYIDGTPLNILGNDMYSECIERRNKLCSENMKGKVSAKLIGTDNIIKVTKDEFDENPNLVGTTKGTKYTRTLKYANVLDENGNTERIRVDSERYINGEFLGHTKGKTIFKNSEGTVFSCCVDDDRVKIGELVGINKGRIVSNETKEKYKIARKGMRPSALKLVIFNEVDEPVFYSDGYFKQFCKDNDLPRLLYETYKQNNKLNMREYIEKLRNNKKSKMMKYLKYDKWYVRKMKRINITKKGET